MWDGPGKGGEEGNKLPRLIYRTQARQRTEVWEFWPVLAVTHSASVSLCGIHVAESNQQLPVSSPWENLPVTSSISLSVERTSFWERRGLPRFLQSPALRVAQHPMVPRKEVLDPGILWETGLSNSPQSSHPPLGEGHSLSS